VKSTSAVQRHRLLSLAAGFAVVAAGAASLSACGGGDDTPAPPPAPAPPPVAAQPLACDISSFSGFSVANATVDAASAVAAGSYTPTGSRTALTNMPAFCKVNGTTSSAPDSLVHYEMWIPDVSAWNGKLVVTGNGGYAPDPNYSDMQHALQRGFATMVGDTGHTSEDLLFVINHPQKIVDWGTSSVHDITVAGKVVLAHMQAADATRSYYYGCSTGGHQAYAEVQRYPTDFDGVVACDPGNNRVALNAEFMNRFLAIHATNDNTTPLLTTAKVRLVTTAAIAACDALDGVTDGVIGDPRVCTSDKFDVTTLACAPGATNTSSCLLPAELTAVQKIYAGPLNPATHTAVYPGPVVGSESGWASYWGETNTDAPGTTEPTRSDFWRFWVFNNPDWNWWTFDYNRDMTFAWGIVGPKVDQVNPDISAFKANGSKLITYQGWADPVVNPLDTIAYYNAVLAKQGSQAEMDNFFRLFMVPGMGHCSGGVGSTNFGNQGGPSPVIDPQHDVLAALDQWVDKGVPPDSIIASKVASGVAVQTRPLCTFPKKAVYSGTGSTDDATNFTCM
jgi:feruloyl esterase